MVLATLRFAKEEGRRVISLTVAASLLMLLFTSGFGGGYSGRWILFVEGGSISGGGGRSSSSLIGGSGFWSSAAAPSNVGIAVAVTAMAGLALAATVVYSRRGSLKSPWSRRRRKHALLPKQWKSFLLPDGKLCDGGVKFLKKVRSGGVDPTIRAEVWPFLLGVYDVNSSKEERESIGGQNRKEYDELRKQCKQIIRRTQKNSGSKENAETSECSDDLSQVLDSASDGPATLQRSLSSERENSEREVSETESSVSKLNEKSKSNHSEDSISKLNEDSGSKHNEDSVSKHNENSVSKHNENSVSEHNEDSVSKHNEDSVAKHNEDLVSKHNEDSVSKHNEDLVSKHPKGSASDQVAESNQLPNKGNGQQSEVDAEKSDITCETATPGDSESTDSDSSESDEPEIVQPFLSSGELDGSDLVEATEENVRTSQCVNKTKPHSDEDFATWQRIIRLDAVRANADWVVYSPSQASITELKARRCAESVGLKDYDHLEPCRVFHAARLVSILEAYALYDPEIGYCQGMSDLLSPIVSVIEDDSEAFWCFVGFMKKARHNFRLDEVGIRRQLNIVSKIIKCKDSHLYSHLEKLQAEDCFFVYRMVVVLFRRELNFDQTLCLWEVIWADQAAIRAGIARSAWGRMRLRAPPSEDLLLYAIAASVLQRRKLIIEKYSSMEEIMRECNSMAGHLDVWKLLDDAHELVVNLHDKI